MTSPAQLDTNVLGIGRTGLLALRHVLTSPPSDPATFLQETGYGAGDEFYSGFIRWLPSYAGVQDPSELDASRLGDVLSGFFQSLGWGSLTLESLGGAGFTVDSTDWAEAEPGINAPAPGCYFSSGFLSNMLSKLAGGEVAVMEVECRSCNDARCRFLAGSPQTLQTVFEAMTAGKDYRQAMLE
jgi:predicted hydrocarbon binding protein